jgi:hypothetical protein
MSKEVAEHTDIFASKAADFWFEHLIDKIKEDQLSLKIGIAPKEKEEMYSAFIQGNVDQLMSQNRVNTIQYYISKILFEYIAEVKSQNIDESNLAFDHSNSKVLVWAVVEDESVEDKLILAQAKINAKYAPQGFYISTSIVEKADNLQLPNHYRKLVS